MTDAAESDHLRRLPPHLLRDLAPRVLGVMVRRYRDFAACEDAVQEALIAAADQWPREGLPDAPRAWLIHVAAWLLALASVITLGQRVHTVRTSPGAMEPLQKTEPDAVRNSGDTEVTE